MISVIYGAKGSGKTKRIIDAANAASEKASGQVIFITDNAQSLGVNTDIRFINIAEYGVNGEDQFIGFLKGMLATNFDIQKVYIDSLSRLLDKPAEELKSVFDVLNKYTKDVDFIATVSADKLPAFLKSYAVKD